MPAMFMRTQASSWNVVINRVFQSSPPHPTLVARFPSPNAAVGHHRDAAIRLQLGHTLGGMFTGHEPPLGIARHAIGLIGRLRKQRDAFAGAHFIRLD